MLPLASRKTTELAPEDAVTPVPPLATGSVPVNVMLGVAPPLDAILPLPVTDETPPPPENGSVSKTIPLLSPARTTDITTP
jgi:hypothetical protein